MKKTKSIRLKMTALFVLFAVLFCLALSVFAYLTSWDAYTGAYAESALEIAEMTASFVDGDRIGGYLETMETDDYYNQLQDTLNTIKRDLNLMYLYIFEPGDDTYFTFIMEAQLDDDDPDMLSELGETYDIAIDYDAFLRNENKDTVHKVILYDEYYGFAVWAYAPIYDSSGGIAAMTGVEISLQYIQEGQADFLRIIILLSSVITVLLVVGMMFVTRRVISKPLSKLTDNALNFASGDRLSSFECDIKTGDEMQTLSEAFCKMADDIKEYIDNLAAVTAEKERIGAELDIATRIQAGLLPCIFPAFPEREEFDIYATMFPAKEVGGDFYDFFLVDGNTLAVVIADVSGKGVPAALFMVIAKTLIKNNAQLGKSPKEVFETVNNTLCENNHECMFVTAFMGYLDLQSGRFTYVNAGHNPPLMRNAVGTNCVRPQCVRPQNDPTLHPQNGHGRYEFIETPPSLVLACFDGREYTENEIQLSPGDMIYLYTDGVTEAENTNGDLFSAAELEKVVNKSADCSVKELLESVKREVDVFAADREQADDITMLALLYKGDGRHE
ncbi:MAG: SpoIIE family protein phosphatase [Oscillospiraceae bacterium]|nr:SpoIIE family protein phosphatase [Oscillospiraceae bacterium]